MKFAKLFFYTLFFYILNSCTPTLNISEIEQRINEYNTAAFVGNIEYQIKNTPKKYFKEYSESSLREKYNRIYSNREYPKGFSNIGELVVQESDRCNSFFYYQVTYIVTTAQMTPYLDSTALKFNYSEYGKENVVFNPRLKILGITKEENKILIFDQDRKWKILNLNKEILNRFYREDFFKCIERK